MISVFFGISQLVVRLKNAGTCTNIERVLRKRYCMTHFRFDIWKTSAKWLELCYSSWTVLYVILSSTINLSTINKKLEKLEFIFEFKIAINFEFNFEIFVNFGFNFDIFCKFRYYFRVFLSISSFVNGR